MNHAREKYEAVLILFNIRSVHNVGSMFRTADAAGISKLFLIGTTATPFDRFGKARKDLAKVALGAELNIPFEHSKVGGSVLRSLKEKGFQLIALEQSSDALDYKKIKIRGKVAFIVGNEVTGLPKSVLKLCDVAAEISMKGKKESLNVAVAAGIFLFRALNI